jgi:hypothetical protein
MLREVQYIPHMDYIRCCLNDTRCCLNVTSDCELIGSLLPGTQLGKLVLTMLDPKTLCEPFDRPTHQKQPSFSDEEEAPGSSPGGPTSKNHCFAGKIGSTNRGPGYARGLRAAMRLQALPGRVFKGAYGALLHVGEHVRVGVKGSRP